jgi:hypothetical protein
MKAIKTSVSIEVTSDFGKTLSEGRYITFNAGYGIGQRYYDITVEVGSSLWVECLWHQVNFTKLGITKAEFMLPMYGWLHKKLPTDLGSNRTDGHSAFSWCNSYHISKNGKTILLNGDKVYTLDGKFLFSHKDKEMEAATPKAPKGLPFVMGGKDAYGTTVQLGGCDTTLTAILNATIVTGQDRGLISEEYSYKNNINWRTDIDIIGYPTVKGQTSCIQCYCDPFQGPSEVTYDWSFAGKGYVTLGYKRTITLLRELGAEVPKHLLDWEASLPAPKKPSYPTEGNGWKLL